jgi:hypothetical protein
VSDPPGKKSIKVGVKEGGGPPPGYRWNVDVLDIAYEEAIAFLNADQYEHLARQVRELASQDDPTHSRTVDLRPIQDFYEIRDKGGILRPFNVRVFFFVHHDVRRIVILGAIHKQNNGPTPTGDRLKMNRRMRLYRESIETP